VVRVVPWANPSNTAGATVWAQHPRLSPLGTEQNCYVMTEHHTNAPTLRYQGLYPCEAEIARRLSQSEKHWRQIAPDLERQGLPKIDPVMKGRFWPAVEAFFRHRHGLGALAASQADGEETWDVT